MTRTEQTERIWHEMHERLLTYIRPRVADAADADDILQDVFIRIHGKLGQLRETQAFTGWAYQITRNAITDYHRRRATATRAMTGLAEQAGAADDNGGESPGAARRAEQDFVRCLAPLLDELPDPQREAIVLTELNGLTQKQAADKLGLSVSGMKSRVQRSRARLKDIVNDCCAIEFDRRGGVVDYEPRNGGPGCGYCSDDQAGGCATE